MRALLLLAAALIAAELLHRRDDDLGNPEEADRFSIAAPLAAAAAILLGPWYALLVSTVCVTPVRRLQGDGWRESAIRGLSLGLAAFAGGWAYILGGSATGSISLPDDLLGLVLLGVAFSATKTLVARLGAGASAFEPDLLSAGAEVALGGAVAIAADANLWNAALLVPVLLLIERLYGRMIVSRREVASALETFANLVDERDPSTHRHSLRVAQLVRELADALDFPRGDAQRLWWAGRLHDLGKVAVDAAALRKTGLLNTHDWEAIRRSPRLSARLLQRFRFAAQQAKAVEYHRERYDGSGYYGARGENVPLAAHFLIVADAYDAMTSERPFRDTFTPEQALAELERNAGSQFHPTVVKAFAAVQRGQRPRDVLSRHELAAIRESAGAAPSSQTRRSVRHRPELLVVLGAVTALVGLGVGLIELTVAGAGVSLLGLALWGLARRRARRLGRALEAALERPLNRTALFFALAEAFESAWPLEYSLLVAWEEDRTDGTIELARGSTDVPTAELTSWLLRESESDEKLIVDDGSELGRDGFSVALPLRRENSALVGFLVLGGATRPPAHLLAAARMRLDRIGLAVADATASPPERRLTVVS
ncbi:MAG TPA: HD domain-containing phosphohydrolase [Gaiellaceae bacterium]